MPTVSGTSVRDRVNAFLANPLYILTLMLLTALSFSLGGELVFYTIIAALVVYICVFGEDLLPLAPIFGCAYIAPSTANNPGRSISTVFSGSSLVLIILIAGVILAAFCYRIIRDRKKLFHCKRKLIIGMLLLSGAYLLSGIGSVGYWELAPKNILFALCQSAGVMLPYWLLTGGVDWKKARKDYLIWIGVGMGAVLLCQVLRIYNTGSVVKSGIIYRDGIYTGWGMYNNLGCMMAMMIPFAFCLAARYKKSAYGILGGAVILLGVYMTCSRTSIIFGTVCFVACICLSLFYTDNRKGKAKVLLMAAGIVVVVLVLLHKPLFRLFSQVLDDASELDSRFDIYIRGMREFFRNPIFGTSFYPKKGLAWGWATTDVAEFLPDRWHNTVIQLLASTGIVGLAAYSVHRLQTVRLVMSFHTKEKWLITCSCLVMLLCSLLDCHFFNVGPTLFYSVTLAFLEKQE